MTTQKTIDALFGYAQEADDNFQAEVIRQFGRKNAGTMRYMGSRHNEQTKAAAHRFHVAMHVALEYRHGLTR